MEGDKMHVTYRYDMSEPDERAEQRIMDRAMELHGAVWDFAQWLRGQIKYAKDGVDVAQFQKARDMLWSHLEDRDLDGLFG